MSDPAASGPTDDTPGDGQRHNALGRSTRDLLLVTGERLFAAKGIEAVSLREIALAAGQRNNTALQYYFGSRAGLVDAIQSARTDALNRRRLQLLASIDGGAMADELIELMIRPYAETVTDPESHYVGFLARLISERGALENVASRHAVDTHLAAHDDVERRLFRLMPTIPHRTVTRRFHQVLAWAIVAFASLARPDGVVEQRVAADLLEDLVPMLSAALTA